MGQNDVHFIFNGRSIHPNHKQPGPPTHQGYPFPSSVDPGPMPIQAMPAVPGCRHINGVDVFGTNDHMSSDGFEKGGVVLRV